MGDTRCSLLTDGSSDIALIPILYWLCRTHAHHLNIGIEWADLRRYPRRPTTLAEKIRVAIDLYPCRLLFIHRDAEAQTPNLRYNEVQEAVEVAARSGCKIPHVCVVPIRMQEAWLLLDEAAIRKAAGNPNGRSPLALPAANRVEILPNPKQCLYNAIKIASDLQGRRLKKLRPERHARLVTEHMTDFAPLRALSAFRRLEADVQLVARTLR